MATVSKFGLMVPAMKVTGGTTRLVEKESFGMLTVISSKVSGRMTKQTVMVSMYI